MWGWFGQAEVVAKEEVAEELQHVHQSSGKNSAECDDEGDLLDLSVDVWWCPGESNEDEQGDNVDKEPDWLK